MNLEPPDPTNSMAVSAAEARDLATATALAETLGLPLLSGSQINTPAFELVIEGTAIALQPHCFESGPITIDFTQGKAMHRLRFGGGRQQPLGRALGLHKRSDSGEPVSVVDTTAGFGKDAWVMACLGCNVVALERCQWLQQMLKSALDKAGQHAELAAIANNLSAVHGDAIVELAAFHPDVVYLDPMYPASSKSAAVKKEMKALHLLIGPDTDSTALLDAALRAAKRRVVVKRPKRAPVLAHVSAVPATSIRSENTRYDIYLVPEILELQR